MYRLAIFFTQEINVTRFAWNSVYAFFTINNEMQWRHISKVFMLKLFMTVFCDPQRSDLLSPFTAILFTKMAIQNLKSLKLASLGFIISAKEYINQVSGKSQHFDFSCHTCHTFCPKNKCYSICLKFGKRILYY